MSVMIPVIRPFWMPTLNQISGRPTHRLSDWVFDLKDYTVTLPLHDQNNFSLDLGNKLSLISSFAFDCDRMAIASFETINSIYTSNSKAFAWLVIQSYYAAFFAAHSILRILGISCTQLEQTHINKVNLIARACGVDNNIQLTSGYYCCVYHNSDERLTCKNLKFNKGGSHEIFWKLFHDEISTLSNNILSSSSNVSHESQLVSTQLYELCNALCHDGCNGGNWLSKVRNNINYRHESSAWFPYSNIKKSFVEELHDNFQKLWIVDPININLTASPKVDIRFFHRTCCFIVSLCHALIQDMALRCPQGKSYLLNGSIKFLNNINK